MAVGAIRNDQSTIGRLDTPGELWVSQSKDTIGTKRADGIPADVKVAITSISFDGRKYVLTGTYGDGTKNKGKYRSEFTDSASLIAFLTGNGKANLPEDHPMKALMLDPLPTEKVEGGLVGTLMKVFPSFSSLFINSLSVMMAFMVGCFRIA